MENKMSKIIIINGIRTEMRPYDLDKNGKTGGIERIQQPQNTGISPIMQASELGETMDKMNNDDYNPNTRFSNIDMRTRLFNYSERNAIIAIESMSGLRMMPQECTTPTRSIKRLNVSMMGKGRQEMVDIVAGKREHDKQSSGFGDKIKGFLGMGTKTNG